MKLESQAARRSLAATLLLASNAGFAADEAVQLPSIEVHASAEASLTSMTEEQAREQIERTPGAVEVIGDDVWKQTQARTIKDVLNYSAGVFAQPKWGEDTRLSIRGSGLSRNFHLRGVQLLVDGIPLNAADGSADFQEIDPSAFRYTEVYKGANALRYGANSLGGAINFVTPTGLDASALQARVDGGSFGFWRAQASAGGQLGDFDGYLSASHLEQDGYRDHSDGESRRVAGNLGYRFSPQLETRFYLIAADIEQRIPGSVTREVALHDPKAAQPNNLTLDYQRNMQTWRVANKTTYKIGGLTLEGGVFAVEKQLIHPIFQYLDYQYNDRGAFARAVYDGHVAGLPNRVTVGANWLQGRVDNQQFQNLAGAQRGNRLSASADRSKNLTLYAEDALQLLPTLSLIGGLQYLDASRERTDHITDDATDTSGRADYDFVSPKIGLLWQAAPRVQVFGNLSRSAEAPSFGELNFTNAALSDTKAQRATTLEIGTRGERGDLRWDIAVYRAQIEHEFQYFDLNGNGNYQVTNADDTVHQGLEVAGQWTFARQLLTDDALSLKLAYTLNDFFFDGDASWGDNDLPGAPKHYLRSELIYQRTRGFYAGPSLEWVPEAYYVDNANTRKTKAYALLGLRAGYDNGQRWSVYVDARNLTDERYIASASVAAVATPASLLYEPGDGFAVFAGVNWKL